MRRYLKHVLTILLAAALLVPSGWLVPVAKAEDTPADNVVLFQSFEDDQTGGWASVWGGPGTTTVSSTYASEGTKSLLFTDRTARDNSPSLNLTGIMQPGKFYDLSLKVRLGSGSDTFHIASKVDSPLLENKYPWMIGDKAVSADAWTTFEVKNYEVPASTAELRIWVESVTSSTSIADIYIDEVLIKDVTPGTPPDEGDLDQSGINADFENGIGNWKIRSANGGGSIEVTNADNHTASGTNSLKVNVSTQYNGPTLDVMGKMHKGHQYRLSAWVKMAPGQTSTSLRISVQSGDSTFTNVSPNVSATDGQWVELAGNFTLATTPSVLQAYVETAQTPVSPVSFYMDDFVLSYIGPVGAPKPIQNLTPIKEVYADQFLIGTAVGDAEFDGLRLELLNKHHNVVTTENAMKPDYAYNTDRQFDFAAEDALVAKIKENRLLLHGHVLVWHQQMPVWLSTNADNTPLDRETALANLRTHIETVIGHFGEDVISWDVVNEAMNDNPPNPADWKASLRNSPWKAALGDNYVEQAFLIAREVIDANGWDIKLYYNDYNDDNQNKATAIANMVKELNEKYALTHPGKLLIDGVGMQAHYNLNTKPDNVEASLKRFIDLGVEVSITEIDITAGTDSVLTEKQATAQGYLYAQLMNIYKKYSDHIARVTFWGLNDANSWRASQSPLLFDKDLQVKPAYYGVIDPDKFIAENPPEQNIANQTTAKFGTPVIDGTIDSIWSSTVEIPINRYQMAWQGANGTAKALWDDNFLYVLFQVNNAELDKTSANAYEHDSIEVFLDQNNGKTASYQADDGQYRVNYDNETSFNPASVAEGFVSATQVSGTNYTVEVKIPLTFAAPANDTELGFDVQINDGKAGSRQSVAAWNDTTGQGYQDTSVYGVLKLIKTNTPEPNPNCPSHPNTTTPTSVNGGSVTFMVLPGTSGIAEIMVSPCDVNTAVESSSSDTLTISVQSATSALKGAKVALPVQDIVGGNGDVNTIAIEAGHVTVSIAADGAHSMLDNDAQELVMEIAEADTSILSEKDRKLVKDYPVYDFNLQVDGETLSDFKNKSVTVEMDYELRPGQKPNQIVVYFIGDDGRLEVVKNVKYNAKTGKISFSLKHF